jgi:hypothetical protein
VEFLKADVTELKEVDRICKEIQKRETKINLLFQTQGNLTLDGRNGPLLLHTINTFTMLILTNRIRKPRRPRPQVHSELLLSNAFHLQSRSSAS